MDDKHLDSICKQIYKRFPEVSGSLPKIQSQKSPLGSGDAASQYLLVFQGNRAAADGKSIHRIVRVVASEQGRILKVTTSR
jgi:hypothetical protein